MLSPSLKIIPLLAIVPGMLVAAAPVNIVEKEVPVNHVYAPAGFNSNDNAEVVVSGFLPNLCYKSPRASVNVVGDQVKIGVKALKNVGSLQFCADVIMPYVEHINIGLLDQGHYKIAVNENSPFQKNAHLKIDEASSNSAEDLVYANVSKIVNIPNSRQVILKGQNPSDCFELDRIEIKDNGVDSFSILPILRQVKAECLKNPVEFSYEVSIPESLPADQVLLHVKVMDGKSLNALYNNNSPAIE